MSSPLTEFAQPVHELHVAVRELAGAAAALELPGLAGREWYELLTNKLVPQLSEEAFLIVAVVGGTNIGKTVVFNHIAGSRASSTSPLASGTKHPTCLIPEGFDESHDLKALFPGFVIRPSVQPGDALQESGTHWLFWRTESTLPDNLVVLDTPDIDSEARINWERADQIRQSADVLVAILTQQKYNDAAVKEFFRRAADEDKTVLIVFNQTQLPEDEAYWPLWIGTFCEETGVHPEHVYLAPYDRRAAEENRLEFYEREWPPSESMNSVSSSATDEGHDLLTDLSELRFAEIKLRTLEGSLAQLLGDRVGLPSYLLEIEQRTQEFQRAAELLSAHQLAEIDKWPEVPSRLLVREIREWWAGQREGWTASIHGVYNTIGRGLTWPVRAIHERIQGEVISPIEVYRRQEWEAILDVVEKVYAKLTWMSELGNPLLRPRLESLLGGTSRAELLRTLEEAHHKVDLELELKQLVSDELENFRSDSPQYYEFIRRIDGIAAAARPATSVVLFVTGFGPLGDAVAPVLAETAVQSLVHIAGDVAGGTVAAAAGETAISGTAATGAGYLEAKFRKLNVAFTARRAAWVAGLLKDHLLGSLPEELQHAAGIADGAETQRVRELMDQINGRLVASPDRQAVSTHVGSPEES
ncbi:MAG: 50S ribosome-binding GTPase [Planctomycetaceae bacterium]|nr:50S ribosome-binding GTPase [Planctomycetaceae bacterium]